MSSAPDVRTSHAPAWKARVRNWAAWSLEEKVELVGLVGLALAAEVAVRTTPLPALTRRLGIALEEDASGDTTRPRRSSARALPPAAIEKRAAAVDRLYRVWPRRDSCLRRALVLGYRVREARPTLRIGVAREGEEIRAHAWIEVDGRVVGDESGEYAPLRKHGS